MPTELSREILDHLTKSPSPRILELLSQGSKPNLNELCRFILAQDAFITNDAETAIVKNKAIKLASLNDPVLIRGASGTGKELIANILHGSRVGNFVAINITAVTETLFESELFGHVKGSFTGAISDRAGLVAQAANGTLFFDEIGDMPLSLQPKILRLLQTHKYRMVGGNIDMPTNCRIVAATHTNLEQLVEDKAFRLDLFYRLSTFELWLKPLRDRLCDLQLFVKSQELLSQLDGLDSKGFCDENYLPGNIRELESIARRWEVFGEI